MTNLIWMLFNGSNLTAGADGLEWNGKTWSLVNHFIPFTEAEVGAPARFASDFMVQYLRGTGYEVVGTRTHNPEPTTYASTHNLQPTTHTQEAQAVLDAGRALWQKFFQADIPHNIRSKYKLGCSDVGWYQIRQSLKDLNASGGSVPVSFSEFEAAYKTLTEKLRPQVYEFGFLR